MWTEETKGDIGRKIGINSFEKGSNDRQSISTDIWECP